MPRCQSQRRDELIRAERRGGFQRYLAGALDSQLVVLIEQQCPDQADDRLSIREDADDVAVLERGAGSPMISTGSARSASATGQRSMSSRLLKNLLSRRERIGFDIPSD